DGIGPEIMGVTLDILREAGAPLEIHKIDIGEKVYLSGEKTGIADASWETIRNTQAFLKAPITTPQGGGFKSLNVTVRTTLGLFANVRPSVAYAPFVATKHPHMNVVVMRENEEDLYTGIEYRQSEQAVHALKVITQPGSEKIVRFAFEYARQNGRKKVTCFTKDNILKLSDGLFHNTFETIAKEYPEIENEHWIVDIGAAKLADSPEAFDVVVMPNLYGDILSDVAAQIAGSVGLAGSANIGTQGAMFEAIHGSAPRRAGQNLANPSGLLHGAIMMLVHLGETQSASLIHNAWLKTIEEGIHTYDIFDEAVSKEKVGTKEFGQAIIARLGQNPATLKAAHYRPQHQKPALAEPNTPASKKTVGVDIFIDYPGSLDDLLPKLQQGPLTLTSISNRGVSVWPTRHPETFCIDQWRCRYTAKGAPLTHQQILDQLQSLLSQELDFTHTENLCTFDGTPFYSQAHES
ncbi:MAG: NADP-dependent isocitrate dehydrogenase, partial [Chlamydiia bacterium]|nr:NADP-dependent isocitrate dehydrogenase [Chlamydiia bacterium]